MLKAAADRFGGVIISSGSLPSCSVAFQDALEQSLEAWREEGRRGVWLTLPPALATHVPVAVAAGFEFHHAKPATGVTLNKWLPADEPSGLPAFANHFCGVGGMVVHEGHVLTVQERVSRIPDLWKIPGGLVDAGEDLASAAVREVLEETGVLTTFERVAGVRESHAAAFGASDLYCVCVLRCADAGLPAPRPQASEIAKAKWMPVEEFTALPYYQGGLFGQLMQVAVRVACGADAGLHHERLPVGFRPGEESGYFGARL